METPKVKYIVSTPDGNYFASSRYEIMAPLKRQDCLVLTVDEYMSFLAYGVTDGGIDVDDQLDSTPVTQDMYCQLCERVLRNKEAL
ncbi:MAG: hypothetical protein ACE5DW_03890 [Thermodesulfobacteriota bacterium]